VSDGPTTKKYYCYSIYHCFTAAKNSSAVSAAIGLKWMQADSTLYCGGTDLTGDGFVNLEDLYAFVENWLVGL
jgi:hypothetical protein